MQSLLICVLSGVVLSYPMYAVTHWGMRCNDKSVEEEGVWVVRALETRELAERIDPATGKTSYFDEFDYRCEMGELAFLIRDTDTFDIANFKVGARFKLSEEAEKRVLDAIESKENETPYMVFEPGEIEILESESELEGEE